MPEAIQTPKSYFMAEAYGCRLSAVLSADTELDVRSGALAAFDSDLHQFADSVLVKRLERIFFENILVHVLFDDLSCVVSGESKSHLGQVVGSEGEELRIFRECAAPMKQAFRPAARSLWTVTHSPRM